MYNLVGLLKRFYPEVEHVKDGKGDIVVVVTKTDANASLKNHKDCVMAKACKRLSGVDGAVISVSTAFIIKGDTAYRYRVPQAITREIVAFDRGASFTPGEYELKAPGEWHKTGKQQGTTRNQATHRKTGRNSGTRHYTKGIRTSLPHIAA